MKTGLALILGCSLVAASSASAFDLFGGGGKDRPFVLAEEGTAKAAIVVPKDAGPGVRYAAGELADYLGKITGGRFAVAPEPVKGYNAILVGTPYKAARQEELCVRVKDARTLEVTGDGPMGTLYAVYDLLETFGCGFYAHDYEVVPTNGTLTLAADYKKVDAPFMTWRDSWTWLGNHDFAYTMKLRCNGGGKFGQRLKELGGGVKADIAQTLTTWFVPRKQFFKDHPEWYAWNRAKQARMASAVCPSSDGMYEELYKEIDDYLQKNLTNGVREVGLGVDDTPYLCECDKCLAIAKSDNNPEHAEVSTAQHVVLINRVAKHFAKKYPGVRFNTLNYGWRGPTDTNKFAFEPNAGAGLAILWRNHGLPCEACERAPIEVERWAKLYSPACGPYVWDYYTDFINYMLPFPNYDIMGPNFRYYKRQNVRGIGSQSSITYCGDMGELHEYLYAKLAWDPDADDKLLISNFVKGVYGPAAPQIQAYLDLMTRAKYRQFGTWIGCYVADTDHYLTGADCVKIQQLFGDARTIVGHDPARRRMVARASVGPQLLALLRYNDMIEPAKKMGYGMPRIESLIATIKQIVDDSSNEYGVMDQGECFPLRSFYEFAQTNAPKATVWPEKTAKSLVIGTKEMTGGKRMTVEHDPAGFDFARIRVSLNGEPENIFMNTGFAEIGYTIPPERAGEWYVFSTVRVGAEMAHDFCAAYTGIYSPWVVNGVKRLNQQELVDLPVAGAKGDESWRTVCLGKRILKPGSRIWVMPGIVCPTRFQDVRSFVLVDPAAFESVRFDVERLQGGAVLRDADDFRFRRIAGTDTVAFAATAKDIGERYVFARVRVMASGARETETAFLTVTQPGTNAVPPVVRSVAASRGDSSWQMVCAGKVSLTNGTTVVVSPGTNEAPQSVDVRDVLLVPPELFGEQ